MSNLDNIKLLLSQNDTSAAISALERLTESEPENDEAWYVMGKAHWRMGHTREAMSCYARASALNPESPASVALEQSRDIADFFNPDLLNP